MLSRLVRDLLTYRQRKQASEHCVKHNSPNTQPADTDEEAKDIAQQIRQYLERHPRSKDTLEGIRSWWLQEAGVPVSRVEKALDWLMAHRLVDRESLPDGGVVFSATKKARTGNKGGE